MGQPAAKAGDQIVAVDMHIVMVPSPPGAPVPTPLPHPFNGVLNGNLSANVFIQGKPAATAGSTAVNQPPHLPTTPGTVFQVPPTNQGTILKGSATVLINNRPAARAGDPAQTCGDPVPSLTGKVVAVSTVLIGG